MGLHGADQLTTDERQRALVAHAKVMGDKLWVTSAFELQNICAEISLQPSIEEIDAALEASGGRIDFAGLLSFVRDMKVGFFTPEARDADTVRAFMAVGGAQDKSGCVDAEVFRQACRRFSLNVDVDGIFREADEESSSNLQFMEFQTLLSPSAADVSASRADDGGCSPNTLKLGIDYRELFEREARAAYNERTAGQPGKRKSVTAVHSAARMSVRPRPSIARRGSRSQLPPEDKFPPITPQQPPPDPAETAARLRAKGIAPALYGGLPEQPAQQTEIDEAQLQANRRKRKRRARQAKCSPAAILGEGTHVVGRRGLLVDDPPRLPRHYPQQNVALGAEGVLSSRAGAVRLPPIHHKVMASPRTGEACDDRLKAIEHRMEDLSRRRLRGAARYRDVPSRVNTTGLPLFALSNADSAGSSPAAGATVDTQPPKRAP